MRYTHNLKRDGRRTHRMYLLRDKYDLTASNCASAHESSPGTSASRLLMALMFSGSGACKTISVVRCCMCKWAIRANSRPKARGYSLSPSMYMWDMFTEIALDVAGEFTPTPQSTPNRAPRLSFLQHLPADDAVFATPVHILACDKPSTLPNA